MLKCVFLMHQTEPGHICVVTVETRSGVCVSLRLSPEERLLHLQTVPESLDLVLLSSHHPNGLTGEPSLPHPKRSEVVLTYPDPWAGLHPDLWASPQQRTVDTPPCASSCYAKVAVCGACSKRVAWTGSTAAGGLLVDVCWWTSAGGCLSYVHPSSSEPLSSVCSSARQTLD